MIQNKRESNLNKTEKHSIKHLNSKPNCKLKYFSKFILNLIWYTCHLKIVRYAFVTLLSLIIYLPCLNNEFVFDDVPAIVQNQVVQQKNPLNNFIQLFLTDYWGTPIYKEESHKSYRPFTIFTFRLNFWFSKLDPFGYQLTNIILHSINSLLNYNFVSQFLDAESSLFASLLFALHPIHVDAVASIVGRAELLSALFVLIVFNWRLTIKKQLPLSYLCCLTIIGLLSKEQGITILPLIIVYETLLLKENDFLKIKINEKSFLLNFVDLTFKIYYFLFDFLKKISHFFISQILLTIFMTLNDKFNFHLKLKVNFHQNKIKLNNLVKKSNKKSTKNALKSDLLFYENLFYKSISSKYVQKIFLLFILILFLRIRVLHKDLPKFSRFDNPMISLSFPYRQLNYINIWSFNFYKILNPYSLACDWSAESIHLITSASDFNIIYLIIIFISFFYFIRRIFALRDFKILFFFLFNIITFLPASNIFFTVGFVFAERILYLPSIGLCALIACSYQKILINLKAHKRNSIYKDKIFSPKNLISLLRLIISLLCILFAIRSWLRTYDWNTGYQLFKSDIRTNPNNTKLLNNLGKIFEKKENYDTAFKYYERAILIQPDDSRGTLNCANLHSKLGNYQQAEYYYRQAIKSIPSLQLNKNQNDTKINYSILNNINSKIDLHHSSSYKLSNTHSSTFNENIVFLNKKHKIEQFVSTMQLRAALNLANLLSNNPLKTSEANQLYEKLIAIKPDHGATYLSWIESILKSSSRDLRTMKHVLVHLLTNAKHLDVNVLYNVAVLISNNGNSMMALQLFDQILKLHPKHEEALLTSARIIRKNSEFNKLHEIAIQRLEKFVSLNQLDHNVFFELGMLYINSNIQKSIEYLQKAIQLKPQFSEALFNLSLLLYKQERASEAIPFLELLLKYDESHQKAMILLIAINSNQ